MAEGLCLQRVGLGLGFEEDLGGLGNEGMAVVVVEKRRWRMLERNVRE